MYTVKWFSGGGELSDAYVVRREVFIVEQGISEELEMDGTDIDAEHAVVYADNQPVATGRLIMADGKMHIGRVAVLKGYRNRGLGIYIMKALINKAYEQGHTKQYVHAQTYARAFYEKLGFTGYGGEFDDAGIPHIAMELLL
jgi:predicted GNAT family N-acyltransferase